MFLGNKRCSACLPHVLVWSSVSSTRPSTQWRWSCGVLGSGPPHFMVVWGSICTWTPHVYRHAAAVNWLWLNVLLLVMICNYPNHQVVYGTTLRASSLHVLSLRWVSKQVSHWLVLSYLFPAHASVLSLQLLLVLRRTTARGLHACRRSHSHLVVSISIRQWWALVAKLNSSLTKLCFQLKFCS